MDDKTFAAVVKDIDEHAKKYVERLREAVAIPSVSGEPEHRKDVQRMMMWTKKRLEAVGAKVELADVGMQTLPDGRTIKLPTVLFGVIGDDKAKKTLLIYGHLDVQPAYKEDGWNTDPFHLTEKDGKLCGRGSSDDKGPVVAWINALDTLHRKKVPLPINIKFCFEGMEESGSKGLEEALTARKDTWLSDVDFTCICDTARLSGKPCLQYGIRGLCYYFVEVSSSRQDLHSGDFGGVIYEPMKDLCWMLAQLTDLEGKINIEGLDDFVSPITDEERKLYEEIEFDPEIFKNNIGVPALTVETKQEILMNRWRYPSLSVHGIEGAFSGVGAKTVIPGKVIGKFSIRLVPNMDPAEVDRIVIAHLDKLWKERGSPNHYRTIISHNGKPWISDFNDPHYAAAARAIKRVFNVDPDYTREGGSIPITLTFQELTGKNILLLPFGGPDDMPHSQNEKIDMENFIEGTKMMAAYLTELGSL
uniref:Peptidase M20 dimerisation domain-containing protein n=1 Tax=Parascaris univalens TaxID=6257 RepID=A0A915AM70_PARUN